jgi:hypothetical protein
MVLRKTLPLIALCSWSVFASAAPQYMQNAENGYWFYQNKPKPPQVVATITSPTSSTSSPAKPAKEKAHPCTSAATWKLQCGFVTPDSFRMQAEERHALIRYMVMHPGSNDAVLNVQRYTKWVVNQALYAGNVWRYNMVNHPSLFPKATNPISEYGLDMAMDWRNFDHQAAWAAIRKFHGQLVLFTRSDCDFCHAQVTPLLWFEQNTHLQVWDASLSGPCDSAFGKLCIPPSESTVPAEILHVKIVPSLYLHLPGKMWIRVSAGLTTGKTLEDRLYNFFLSWRLGVQKHLKNDIGGTGVPMDLNPEQKPMTSEQVLHVLFGATPPVPKN